MGWGGEMHNAVVMGIFSLDHGVVWILLSLLLLHVVLVACAGGHGDLSSGILRLKYLVA